jgi:predicted transcriptional regulator
MIIRTKKENGGFTQVDNRYVRDKNLSLSAKGLLTYMLSQINDWNFTAQNLQKETNSTRTTIENALNELEERGYLKREKKRESGKFVGIKFIVYEESIVDRPRLVFE